MSGTDIRIILNNFPEGRRDALIPLLQAVQESQGFISRASVVQIGEHLKLPASKIYGAATFYNQFRFQPLGRCLIQVCRGTACHVKNSAAVLDAFKRQLKIEPGQTTRDGLFSLEVVACIGACGLAPVVAAKGEFHGGVSPDSVKKLINTLRREVSKQ